MWSGAFFADLASGVLGVGLLCVVGDWLADAAHAAFGGES